MATELDKLDSLIGQAQETQKARKEGREPDIQTPVQEPKQVPQDRGAQPDPVRSINPVLDYIGNRLPSGESVLDFAKVAADEAIFGLTRPVNTALFGSGYAAKNVMDLVGETASTPSNGSVDPEAVSDFPKDIWGAITSGYDQAYGEIDQSLDQSTENLGLMGNLGASVVGGLMPAGPARQVDKTIDAASDLYRSFRQPAHAALKRVGTTAGLTGATNALQAYFQGYDPEDMAMAGMFGAATGGAVQAALGDQFIPALRQDFGGTDILGDPANFGRKPPNYGGVLKGISDSGMDPSGLSLASIDEAVRQPTFPGGLLDREIGDAPLYRNWQKLNDFVTSLNFDKLDQRTVDQPVVRQAIQRHQDVLKSVADHRASVNAQALEDAIDAVQPRGRAASLERAHRMKGAAADMMGRLSRTTPTADDPNPLGAQLLNTRAFLDSVEDRLPAAFGRRDMTESPLAARKMYNKFNDLLRGIDQESVARDYRNIPSEGRRGAHADEIFADIPLARLMDARAKFASSLTPAMAFQNGTDPIDLKAGVKILKMVDEQLDSMTSGQAGLARGQFAQAMRTQEAYNLGKTVYSQRTSEMNNKEGFSQFYGDSVEAFLDAISDTDPQIEGAFKDGFRDALIDAVNKRSFAGEMHNLVGDYSATAASGTGRTKTGGVVALESVLGKNDTQRLLSVYENVDELAKNTDSLVENLRSKGMDRPTAKRVADMAANTVAIDPQDHRASALVIGPLIEKLTHLKDPRKVDAVMRMLDANGEPLRGMMETGLEQAAGGYPQSSFQFGAGLTAGGSILGEDEEPRQQQPPTDIMQLLGL